MAKLIKINNYLKSLIENKGRKRKITFGVTYKAPYALRQHEDLTLEHPNGGQAKFLETPMRLYRKDITKMIKNGVAEGLTLREATLAAANWLMEESKKLVPVDTGVLKNSAEVKIIHQE